MVTEFHITCNRCGWTHVVERHDADDPDTYHALNAAAYLRNRAAIDAHTATHQDDPW